MSKTLNKTRIIIKNFIKQNEEKTDYIYSIFLNTTKEFIGIVSLHNLNSYFVELGALLNLANSLGLKKVYYPVDKRNMASKKIPIYYGGKVVENKEVKISNDKILFEEIFEINIK